jgi:hypothetical protein
MFKNVTNNLKSQFFKKTHTNMSFFLYKNRTDLFFRFFNFCIGPHTKLKKQSFYLYKTLTHSGFFFKKKLVFCFFKKKIKKSLFSINSLFFYAPLLKKNKKLIKISSFVTKIKRNRTVQIHRYTRQGKFMVIRVRNALKASLQTIFSQKNKWYSNKRLYSFFRKKLHLFIKYKYFYFFKKKNTYTCNKLVLNNIPSFSKNNVVRGSTFLYNNNRYLLSGKQQLDIFLKGKFNFISYINKTLTSYKNKMVPFVIRNKVFISQREKVFQSLFFFLEENNFFYKNSYFLGLIFKCSKKKPLSINNKVFSMVVYDKGTRPWFLNRLV